MKLKTLLAFAAALCATASLTAAPPDAFAEKIADGRGFSLVAFWPANGTGVCSTGDVPRFVLKVAKPDARTAVKVAVDIRPYEGVTERDVATFDLKDGENAFELAPRAVFGHWTVTARFSDGKGDCGFAESAFAVLPPEPVRRDPYFVIDKNGSMDDRLLDEMKRIGFGSLFIHIPHQQQVLSWSEKQYEAEMRALTKGTRKGPVARSGDFRIIGGAGTAMSSSKLWTSRVENGLAPFNDEELLRVRRHYRRVGETLADVCNLFIVQEEYDCFMGMGNPSTYSTNFVHFVAGMSLMMRNICDGLHEGQPGCKIAALGCYGGDYYSSNPPFSIARRILWPNVGRFDWVALDAYSGNWNATRGIVTPPEDSFAALLKAGAALSAEFGCERKVVNAERCAGIDWRAAFDSFQAHDQADKTVRAMIIQKAVPEAMYYTHHLMSHCRPARDMRQHPDKEPMPDLGSWRCVLPDDVYGREMFVPRPSVSLMATAVPLLSFAHHGSIRLLDEGAHLATFDAPGGDEALSLAALWTMNEWFEADFTLTKAVTKVDAMGNSAALRPGVCRLRVSPAPIYFTFPKGDRAAVEGMLSACTVRTRDEKSPLAPVAVCAALPEKPMLTLTGPRDIAPERAVMPEAGFFPKDATVFPKAEAKFAWDADAFIAEIVVSGKRHVQRRKGGAVENDDCVILSFYDFTPVSEQHPRKPTNAGEFFASADASGGHGYVVNFDAGNGGKAAGTCEATVEDTTVRYRVKVPWDAVMKGFKPVRGARFAFNLRCPFAASEMDWRPAPYMLILERQPFPKFSTWHGSFIKYCRYMRLD